MTKWKRFFTAHVSMCERKPLADFHQTAKLFKWKTGHSQTGSATCSDLNVSMIGELEPGSFSVFSGRGNCAYSAHLMARALITYHKPGSVAKALSLVIGFRNCGLVSLGTAISIWVLYLIN